MKRVKRKLAFLFSLSIIFLALNVNEIHMVSAVGNELAENAVYTAPGATGTGSYDNPMDFEAALLTVENGQTIYMLEGTYKYNHTITIAEGNDGEENNYKNLRAYPGAAVVIDFSQQACNNNNRGIILDGNYWHIYGITIYGAGDNGMLLSGDYNIIEMCIFDNNRDTGLQISRNKSYDSISQWPSYNYILNCTSRNNHDPAGENADGFAPKLTCGEGNVFDGCMAYNNVDDGWDCYAKSETGPIGKITIINCIAFRNGQTEDGTFTVDSDGNGFKLGGSGIGTPHTVINCLAFENQNCGFVDNNNPTALTLINCTAFNNNLSGKKYNYNVYRCKDANCINLISYSQSKAEDTFQNTFANYVLYYKKSWFMVDSYMALDSKNSAMRGTQTNNGLQASDFIVTEPPALGTDFHTLWRNADGSLNTQGYAMISQNSGYATFATDGKAAGARFGSEKSDYFTPANVEMIKAAATGNVEEEGTTAESSTATQETSTEESTDATEGTTTVGNDGETSSETESTTLEETVSVSGDTLKNGFSKYIPLIVAVVVAGIMAVAIVATFVIVRKRK